MSEDKKIGDREDSFLENQRRRFGFSTTPYTLYTEARVRFLGKNFQPRTLLLYFWFEIGTPELVRIKCHKPSLKNFIRKTHKQDIITKIICNSLLDKIQHKLQSSDLALGKE